MKLVIEIIIITGSYGIDQTCAWKGIKISRHFSLLTSLRPHTTHTTLGAVLPCSISSLATKSTPPSLLLAAAVNQ